MKFTSAAYPSICKPIYNIDYLMNEETLNNKEVRNATKNMQKL